MGLCCLESKHEGLCSLAAPTAVANWRADLTHTVWKETAACADPLFPSYTPQAAADHSHSAANTDQQAISDRSLMEFTIYKEISCKLSH